MRAKLFQSCPTLCDPMDCSLPAPLSMGFSGLEYCSKLPYPPPGDLPNPGIKPVTLKSSALQAGSLSPTKVCFATTNKSHSSQSMKKKKVLIVMKVSTGHTEPTIFFFHFI